MRITSQPPFFLTQKKNQTQNEMLNDIYMDYLKEKQWKLEKYYSTTMIMHEGKADAKRNAKLEWCQTNNGKNRNTLVVWENIHMEHTYN